MSAHLTFRSVYTYLVKMCLMRVFNRNELCPFAIGFWFISFHLELEGADRTE